MGGGLDVYIALYFMNHMSDRKRNTGNIVAIKQKQTRGSHADGWEGLRESNMRMELEYKKKSPLLHLSENWLVLNLIQLNYWPCVKPNTCSLGQLATRL